MKQAKKIVLYVTLGILLLSGLYVFPKLWEDVDAGEIVVIQSPIDGTITIFRTPGLQWQGMGKVTKYKKSNQFWFLAPKTKDDEDLSMPVKWNDGGHANISGSVRYDLPTDDVLMKKIHVNIGSQKAIESQLIKTNIEKSIFMSGPLMSSKESYAERRNDLIYYIEDQASRGVYKTKNIEAKELDPLTNEEKMVTRVQIMEKTPGNPARQEESPVTAYGIRLYNISINGMKYDATVEKQIQTQQQAIMNVQTAIANAKRAEQDAITTAKQGEADAAKAKWEQEVIKASLVTEAEAKKRVAELDVQTAELTKKRMILEGEGEGAKKKAAMVANGALEQKLDAWLEERKYAWDAFSKFQGNMVPLYQSGGASGGNATQWMEIMGINAAKQLNLDLKTK